MKSFFKGFEKKANLAQKITSMRPGMARSAVKIKQPKVPKPSMAIRGSSSMKI